MSKFWGRFMQASAMAANEFFNESEQSRKAKYKQKCAEKVAESSQNMFNIVCDRLDLYNAVSIPKNLVDGSTQMILYIVQLVLRKQNGPISEKQHQLVDTYFENFTCPYSKREFFESLRISNHVTKRIEELLAIDHECVGLFWKEFFKAIDSRNDSYEIIDDFIKELSTCITNFTLLGDNEIILSDGIMNNFKDSIYDKFAESENSSLNDMESNNQNNYIEHFHNMENEIHLIQIMSNCEEDELNLLELYEYFCMGLFYLVINQGVGSLEEKSNIFDRTAILCTKEFEFSGKEVFESFKYDKGLGPFILNMVSNEYDNNFWTLLATLISKCSMLCEYKSEMIKECLDFMIGLEQSLSDEYPESGYGNFAANYAQSSLQHILEVCSQS